MYKRYCYSFSFSVVYICIHFISCKKKDERELFYSTVCIHCSSNLSNGDTRLEITRLDFSSSFSTFWDFNMGAGGTGGYILGGGGW